MVYYGILGIKFHFQGFGLNSIYFETIEKQKYYTNLTSRSNERFLAFGFKGLR